MLSRRVFLAAGLGILLTPSSAIARKQRAHAVSGPHTLAREQWPPSMTPDFLSVLDKGNALIADQSGRLAIVDLKHEQGPQVLGELSGIGRKIVDMKAGTKRACALTYQESGNDQAYAISLISIYPPAQPSVISRSRLSYLTEPNAVAVSGNVIAVAGTTADGASQVLLLAAHGKGRSDESDLPLATLNLAQPPTALAYQDKRLVILEGGADSSMIEVYNLASARAPQKVSSFALRGTFELMARCHDLIVLSGSSGRHPELQVVSLRPAPKAVSRQRLPMSEVFDIAAQPGEALVLGNQGNRLVVLPVNLGKNFQLAAGQPVILPADCRGSAKAKIVLKDKEAYIVTDNGNIQVLSVNNDGWRYVYSHAIPRLPVSSVAMSGSNAILVGADIKIYDLSVPDHPKLTAEAQPDSAVRDVAAVSDCLLTLTRDALSLRKLDTPSQVVASLPMNGHKLAFDGIEKKAYVLSVKEKATTITPVRVSKALVAEQACELPGTFEKASALSGKILLSGLNSICYYDMSKRQQLGTRQLPNLAVRDLFLTDNLAAITAIDASSRGVLLLVDLKEATLSSIGSIDLPHDAVALAVSGTSALIVGRSPAGKDVASVVDLSNRATPKVIANFDVVDSASAVAIEGKLALVGGRGLEVVSLS